ncbi:MAG: type II secretion system protein M [Myxococcales bacterium]|nr:type II secretion system protein M [Myxococcales bacterium]
MALDQMSARERTMVTAFGIIFGVIAALLVPLRVSSWLGGKQHDNDDLRQAIQDVQAARARLATRRAALGDVAARYANKAPPLGTLVDAAAKSAGLEIAVQTDVAPVPRGKLYMERATKLSIQKTGLKALANFLEKLETSGHPVAITQLDMSKRIEADSFTVSLTLSAYDRIEPAAASSGPPAAGSTKHP